MGDGVRGAARRRRARRLPRRHRRGRPRRALLHGRHDRRVEGRDAHATATSWPTRCTCRRSGRSRRRRAGSSSRRCSTPRARSPCSPTVWNAGRQVVLPAFDPAAALDLIERERRHRDAGRPDDAGGDERRAARPPARRLVAALHQPRRRAERDRDAAPRPRARSPTRELMHDLRRDRDGADRHAAAGVEERCSTRRRRARAGSRRSASRSRIVGRRRRAARRPARWARSSVRGPNVMAGYWNKPEQTAAALVDGWYHTGDLGYMDDEGFVYLVDRAKDMIVTGGENVYSHRGRGRPLPPPGGARGGGVRRPGRALGRGGARGRRAARAT